MAQPLPPDVMEALEVLELQMPEVHASSLADAQQQIAEWKEGPLKSAYRQAALDHHPDRNPGDESAEARFKAISSAYELLGERVCAIPLRSVPSMLHLSPEQARQTLKNMGQMFSYMSVGLRFLRVAFPAETGPDISVATPGPDAAPTPTPSPTTPPPDLDFEPGDDQ